jgi:signal transduction histidine kinase
MHSQETKLYIAILIAAIIIGIIFIYFIITIIRQQRKSFHLYQEKVQSEINTLEKERSRVSRDLHDELGPLLLSVKYNLNSFDTDDEKISGTIRQSDETLTRIIGRVREISNDLLPDALLRKGLAGALKESIEKICSRTQLTVEFRCAGMPQLSLEKSVSVFRIVQEIIHNTLKHAQATKLLVELKCEAGQVVLLTEDDGCGFNQSSALKEFKGIGLRSLLSRADLLNGNMYLDSKTGKGTRYIFEIPV